MKYIIQSNSSTTSKYPFNEQEEEFFNYLHSLLTEQQNSKIQLLRMGNGAISVSYNTYPIGKIKLSGKKQWMQILKGVYTNKIIEGSIQDFIEHVPDWLRYIRLHCK